MLIADVRSNRRPSLKASSRSYKKLSRKLYEHSNKIDKRFGAKNDHAYGNKRYQKVYL